MIGSTDQLSKYGKLKEYLKLKLKQESTSSVSAVSDLLKNLRFFFKVSFFFRSSFADPDPYVFGPSGSGLFYHQAQIARKTLTPTVL
jgi:hypothetical protein